MDMVASSNRIINAFPPLNNITAFTRVDGWSFLEVLEGLRYYVVETLVKEIDMNNELISKQLNEWFDAYTKDFDELKTEWQTLFDEFMANVVIELEGLNDQAIINLIKKKYSHFSVVDFGAKGDGVTNDTASIQAALDAAYLNGGGVVTVPASANQYRVGKLYIRSNTTLLSEKGVTFGRITNTYGVTNLRPNGSLEFFTPGDKYSSHGNIVIDGGVWESNVLSEPFLPGGYDHFYFACARNITVRNVEVRDIVTNHCLDINGINGLTVEDNRFLGYKDGTVEQNRQYTEAIQIGGFSENTTIPGGDNGAGAPSMNVMVRRNVFGNSGTLGMVAWPSACGNHSAFNPPSGHRITNNITIENNVINDAAFGGLTPYTWDDVTIRNNVFNNCTNGIVFRNFTNGLKWNGSAWITADGLRFNTHGLYILENIFNGGNVGMNLTGTGKSGVDGSWAQISNVVVRGNTRKGDNYGSFFIRILIADDVNISNNQARKVSNGVRVESGRNVMISNNDITDTTDDGILCNNANAVADNAFPLYNLACTGNKVSDAGKHGISIIGIDGVLINGNAVFNAGRSVDNSTFILSNLSNGVLITSNYVNASSAPRPIQSGIGTYTSSNARVTLDNIVRGISPEVTGDGIYSTVNYRNNIGWTDLTLQPGITAYDAGSKPQFMVDAGILYLRGAVKGVPSNPLGVQVASFPSNYAPERNTVNVGATEGSSLVRWNTTTGGGVFIENTDLPVTDTSSWYPLPTVGIPNKNF